MSRLAELGLSGYEEQCYRALLARGPSTARAVSDASGVPMGRVYDVLNGLAARDLVETRPGEPTRYCAVDPETAADRLLAERKRELAEQTDRYERLAAALGDELAAVPPTESRFWTAPLGGETAVSLTRQVFEDASDEVRSAMSRPYVGAPWDRYDAEIAAFDETLLTEQSVRVLVAAPVLDTVPAAVRDAYLDREAVSLRVTTALAATFDLVDDDRVYLHVAHPLDEGERLGAVELRDDALLARLQDRFERAWERAETLSALR
ncbi:TrmB family transcriptional regulator [Halobacterium salinarum]|uniref:TrmB family transcriptional regulator n=1 Tax=Halobacterium salinarum TaxID=2242 RepID=UPI001F2B8CEE|nr:TrmB family transcriptional regulator [Halobacterium salinarum]MCF2207309.1 TrmB family transcriptional regulator [Halobacterium salinarum]MCF2240331.1 TrmB family transcriptional regulator [Halobacterium salinarum]